MSHSLSPATNTQRTMASFQPGHRPMNSMDLAKQYEIDMKKINDSLFQEVDSTNQKIENYLSHVRIIEDAKSPSSRPPPNSPQSNKKNRFLLLSVKASGRMRLHKAKESSSGMIQIGRSWDFDELVLLELDDQVPTGFLCQMGKKYYWEVHTPKERRVWCSTLLDNYIRYTHGKLPQLVNCSVDYFHLENLYDSFHGGNGTIPPQVRTSNSQNFNRTPVLSPKRNSSSNTFANAQRSPSKSNSQDLTSLKKNLGNSTPVNPSMAAAVRGASGSTLPVTATSRSPDLDNRQKLEQERRLWEEQKQKDAARKQQEENKRLQDAQRHAEEQERQKQAVMEQRRKQEIEKRRQQELERRKQKELERRKQEELERAKQQEETERAKQQEELERARKQEELERARRQEEEEARKREQQQQAAAAAAAERRRQQQQLEEERIEKEKSQQAQRVDSKSKASSSNGYQKQKSLYSAGIGNKASGLDEIAKRGPPSGMLSNEPSQMSFEIGDEYRFQNVNASIESDLSVGIDNYIDGYASTGEEETAPLNLAKPRARSVATADPTGKLSVPAITTTLDEVSQPRFGNHGNLSNISIDSELNKLLTPVNRLESMEDEIDKSFGEDTRHHARSRAFSRVSESTPDGNDLLEVLEEIGYDPIEDDSATLQKKLLKELDKLQYDKIETLINVTGVSSALKQSISTAFQNCDHIDPILALFGVQLSTFKDDVDFIEEQGHGLQVEATNEKLLMNELNEIVHSVEISDSKLQKLLGTRITLGYQNFELEKILNELYNALSKVSGSQESADDDHGISKMKALQEKKKSYENVRDTFVSRFKRQAGKIFESVSLSLSSKLENVSSDNFDSNFLKTIFLDKMSYLLTLEGLIAFVKSVSVKDYYDIVNSYVTSMRPFFENLAIVLMRKLDQRVSVLNVQKFSFNSDPAILIDGAYMSTRSKKDFGSSRANVFSKNQSSSSSNQSADNDLIKLINTYFSQAVNVMSVEQELMKKLFTLSSSPDLCFENLVKRPLETRCEEFVTTANFLNGSIEADREMGDYIFDIMRQVFDSTFGSILKILLSVSKRNILQTPGILCLLKSFSQSLAPTSHEYLYGNFTKLETKVNSIWIKEIDQQSQEISASKVNCHVMNYVKAYPVFFSKIHSIVDSLNLVNIVVLGTDQKVYGNYYMMWDHIKNSLSKGVESMKIEVVLHDATSDDHDIDADASTQKHLTLWINYKWIFEESKNLLEFPKDLSRSIDDLRDQELRAFSESFGRRYKIGNIIRLVEDLESLLSNDGNPSTFSTYSVDNIKSLMVPFKGDSFKQEISNLASGLKTVLKGRCYYVEDKMKENELSVSIGQQIEKELYNNCMFALCQLYISTFTKLSSIVDKYYNNFEVPVDKYIINFNFKKNYIS